MSDVIVSESGLRWDPWLGPEKKFQFLDLVNKLSPYHNGVNDYLKKLLFGQEKRLFIPEQQPKPKKIV